MVQSKRFLSPLVLVLGLSGVFFILFITISGIFYFSKSPSSGRSSTPSANLFSTGAVGIVELNGVIMDSKKILARLERFEEDDHIKAVVMRLNSPGGAVAPSQEIYEAVRSYKKPLVVSMGSIAASGAFYVAMGAKKVFANPGTMTGSIGVIMEFVNLEKLYSWAKVNRYVVKTGKYKDIGSEFRAMTDEEHALLKDMITDVLGQFKQAIAKGRNLPLSQVSEIADGRIFSGAQAKSLRLVDELGTIRDAIQAAADLGKIKGKPAVVYTEKKKHSLMDFVMDDGSGNEDAEVSRWNRFVGQAFRLMDQVSAVTDDATESQSGLRVPGAYLIWKGAMSAQSR